MRIKVGDSVRYRGDFGSAPAAVVTVKGIELTTGGDKYGASADSFDLSNEEAVLDLSDGHWAYSRQIDGLA